MKNFRISQESSTASFLHLRKYWQLDIAEPLTAKMHRDLISQRAIHLEPRKDQALLYLSTSMHVCSLMLQSHPLTWHIGAVSDKTVLNLPTLVQLLPVHDCRCIYVCMASAGTVEVLRIQGDSQPVHSLPAAAECLCSGHLQTHIQTLGQGFQRPRSFYN